MIHIKIVNLSFELQDLFCLDLYIRSLSLERHKKKKVNRSCYQLNPDNKELIFHHTEGKCQLFTWTPPEGWCIIILAFGKEWRIPFVPEANSKDAILQACPTHLKFYSFILFALEDLEIVSKFSYQVAMGGSMYCMVS